MNKSGGRYFTSHSPAGQGQVPKGSRRLAAGVKPSIQLAGLADGVILPNA